MESFKVHNSVRDVKTRLQRRMAPTSPRMKQYLGGGELRVLRGRPVVLTREQLEVHLEELKERTAAGVLWVSTMDDQEVDLETLSPTMLPPAEPKAPEPVLDSANNDKNEGVGQAIPQFAGGLPLGAVPSTDAPGGIPGPLEAEQLLESAPVDPAAAPEEMAAEEPSEMPFEDPASNPSGKKKGKK